MFKNIIWDFDGTLFNTYPAVVSSFRKALSESGVEVCDNEILKYMKVSTTTAINHFKEIYSLNNEFIDKYVYYEHNLEADKIIPFPYAREVCMAFKNRGGRNFILTHRGKTIFNFLKYHDMIDCFEEIATKDNCFKRKPDPEGFVYFVKKYNMDNDTSLAVGDRECDISGAKRAGIKTCLYNTNNVELKENADYKIDSLSELFDILCIK